MSSALSEALNHSYLAALSALPFPKAEAYSMGGGMRLSVKRGRSMDFSGYREYVPGDEINKVDWHGYARFNRHYVKLFADERRSDVNIFLDVSASMLQDVDKRNAAQLLCASIAYRAAVNQDYVHVFAFDSTGTEQFQMPTVQKMHECIHFLEALNPPANDAPNQSLFEAIGGVQIHKGLSFVISDFFWETDIDKTLSWLHYHKQGIRLVHLLALAENTPAQTEFSGYLRLIDSETDQQKNILIDATLLARYQQVLTTFKNEIKDMSRRHQCRYYFTTSKEPPMKLMRALCETSQ